MYVHMRKIMHVKLTLRLDEDLIRRMKLYAQNSGKSLSQIVSDFFSLIGEVPQDAQNMSPRVRSLYGAFSNSEISEDEYRQHIESKHR